MKANEAPEKIYLERIYLNHGVLPNGINFNETPNDIEYIRTDAFIKKAAEWLSNMPIEDMEYKYDEFNTSEGWHKMIEDFKKYMEK